MKMVHDYFDDDADHQKGLDIKGRAVWNFSENLSVLELLGFPYNDDGENQIRDVEAGPDS